MIHVHVGVEKSISDVMEFKSKNIFLQIDERKLVFCKTKTARKPPRSGSKH